MLEAIQTKKEYRKIIEGNIDYCLTKTSIGLEGYYQGKVRDINKMLVAIPLIITYLIGPIGLFLYWIIRIFYAKRMNLYE